MSEMLPRVAAVRFNSCVELALYEQLNNNVQPVPSRDTALASCREQADARDRLMREFSVLTSYFTVLGELASGDHAGAVASASSAASSAVTLAGVDSGISGLAGAIAGAVLQARANTALKNAITAADPHIQAYAAGFQQRIAPVLTGTLKNQERELTALYTDSVRASPANRLLLYRQFDAELRSISETRDLIQRYSVLMKGIAAAHAHLFANRSSLRSKETSAAILQDAANIDAQLAALNQTSR